MRSGGNNTSICAEQSRLGLEEHISLLEKEKKRLQAKQRTSCSIVMFTAEPKMHEET